jgi:hypothetical protein
MFCYRALLARWRAAWLTVFEWLSRDHPLYSTWISLAFILLATDRCVRSDAAVAPAADRFDKQPDKKCRRNCAPVEYPVQCALAIKTS